MAAASTHNRNQEATVWVGGLEPQCTEELLFELMVNAGPVVEVSMPRDKITGTHQGYGFVEFANPEDADYAIRIMNMIRLHGKPIRVNKASKNKDQEVLANLFVGNLDPDVDEKLLYDTFSAFGCVLSAKVMTDPDSGQSKGYGFVNYDDFESADAAIAAMNSQFLCNRTIHVSYAYKKDGTKGERHGSKEERELAKRRGGASIRPQAQIFLTTAPQALPPPLPTGLVPTNPFSLQQMQMRDMQMRDMQMRDMQNLQMGMRGPPPPPMMNMNMNGGGPPPRPPPPPMMNMNMGGGSNQPMMRPPPPPPPPNMMMGVMGMNMGMSRPPPLPPPPPTRM